MDGTLAALVLAVSLADMGLNHCPTGCLGTEDTPPRWAVSTGALLFQEREDGAEVFLRRDLGLTFGPFQPSLGLSVATGGATWIGAGVQYTLKGESPVYFQGHVMPGVYFAGDGRDIGGALQFRSGIEIGYEAASGLRLGLGFDHRSNADLDRYNPGLETLVLRLSWPI